MRKSCKECPWHGKKLDSWQDYVNESVKDGRLKSIVHNCHMITNETWTNIIDNTICIGSCSPKQITNNE